MTAIGFIVKERTSSHIERPQTEELVADSRMILTPSQRVDEKLAACTGQSRVPHIASMRRFGLRRTK